MLVRIHKLSADIKRPFFFPVLQLKCLLLASQTRFRSVMQQNSQCPSKGHWLFTVNSGAQATNVWALLCMFCSSHGLPWLVCLAGRNRRTLCDINNHLQYCDQGRDFVPDTSTEGNHKCLVHIPTCVWDLFEALRQHYFEIKPMSALITFTGAVRHICVVKIPEGFIQCTIP